jgi:crotonobetainyl-CoA:carnitine CoA-transferase CaiB-like acyl-CoA transferase
MVVEIEQPELGTVRGLGVPVKLGRTPGDPTRPAPALGEHTEAILAEAGYSPEQIEAMLAAGAAAGVGGAEPTEFSA